MHRTAWFTLLLSALSLTPALVAQPKPPPDPTIVEFKKHIRSTEPTVRGEQLDRLARVDTAESAKLAVQYGAAEELPEVRDRAVSTLGKYASEEARAAILEGLKNPKVEVRWVCASGIAANLAWNPPPVQPLLVAFEAEKAPGVKIALADALGRTEDIQAATVLSRSLAGEADLVIIGILDGIALLRKPEAHIGVIPMLQHHNWRVQTAALHALGMIRTKESIGPIIDYLDAAIGRPREDARRALIRITQRTFGMDANLWREWWERSKATFTVPPEGKGELEEKDPVGSYDRRPVEYHRIKTFSQKILFVIDVSTSMEVPILLRAGVTIAGRQAPPTGTPKLEIAREELAHVLRSLDSEVKFNIIAFETDLRFFKKESIPASAANVQDALKWLERQKAWKPSSSAVQSSGVDKDGYMMGKTNTYAALRAAFGLSQKRTSDSISVTGAGPKVSEVRPPYDTCYFLSDGEPTEGEITNIDHILREVEKWNKAARMVIHTIGMEESQGLQTLLDGIARITGGRSVFLGR